MFESVGWGEILVLILAGLFILGPERLPAAAAWLGRSVRKVREFASGAGQQLRDQVGPDLDEFRKPLEDLRGLRGMNPRQVVTRHLFDGDTDPLGLRGSQPRPQQNRDNTAVRPGGRPPIDTDAT